MPHHIKRTKKILPRTEKEREEVRIQTFLDMITPSIIKFYADYFICGNHFRSVWAIREYPTQTEELAILRHLGEKSGITLRIYSRHVTPIEERKIIANATSKNRLQSQGSNDLQQNVIAESNLQDMVDLVANMHRNREPLLHCAVYIETSAVTIEKLKELQMEVIAELTRSKIAVDKLLLQQKKGFLSSNPCGFNAFADQFERVLPASSTANLYPLNYSGKTDKQGFYIGHDKFGSNIIVDFQKRDDDKTNANMLILGNSGQGKSYLMKLIITNMREAGMNVVIMDAESEYKHLTEELGGCYLNMISGEYKINILEPKLWSEDQKEKSHRLSQHISFLRDFFHSYKSFTDEQIDTLEILIQKLYDRWGLSDKSEFSKLQATDYPILSDLYKLIEIERQEDQQENENSKENSQNNKRLYTKECLREVSLKINSICKGTDSNFFNGHTNITTEKFVCFGVKEMLETNKNLKDSMLFNILSYMTNALLTIGNTALFIDEFYLFLTNLIAVEYVRNFMKRVRKKGSSVVLASQNLEDFTIDGIAEYTKPLFAIPTHQFIFNCGNIDQKVYMNLLQMEESEYELIKTPQRGNCLYKCGLERYCLVVKAPKHKSSLFGSGGGV